uniref:Uncharacterized protein n=1 Tax=Timema cristinae TaxID=61476 RepID=A0A7R9CZU7_TIMCR|nr:unnamed protein product [Timema cristinae]
MLSKTAEDGDIEVQISVGEGSVQGQGNVEKVGEDGLSTELYFDIYTQFLDYPVCCTVVVPGELIRVYYGVRNGPIEPPTSTTRRPLIYPTFAPAPVREDQELDTNFINRRPYKFIERMKTIPKSYVPVYDHHKRIIGFQKKMYSY